MNQPVRKFVSNEGVDASDPHGDSATSETSLNVGRETLFDCFFVQIYQPTAETGEQTFEENYLMTSISR